MTFESSSNSQAKIRPIGVPWGSLLVSEYEIGFLDWSRRILMLYSSELDMLCGFIKGSILTLRFVSEHLIEVGSSFSQVVNYTKVTESACVYTYEGGLRRPCHQYSVISILSGIEDPSSRDQLHL